MKIRELDDTEQSGFDSERRWLNDNLRQFGDELVLRKTPDDIATLQSLLDVEPFASGDEGSLEVLGAALGDIICATLDMRWVVVEDEHGIDFAISAPGRLSTRRKMNEDLIQRLQERIRRSPSTDLECVPPIQPRPVLTPEQVASAETELGFMLPPGSLFVSASGGRRLWSWMGNPSAGSAR